jgi:GntR family transcriptional regulator
MKEDLNLPDIDKSSPIPIYYQIKEILLELISTLKRADSIPSEMELCNHFHVTRPTVRQTIQELVSEGYLYKEKGKGTFVSSPRITQNSLYAIQSFRSEMERKGLVHRTVVLEAAKISCDNFISKQLQIKENTDVIKLRRLRIVDEIPLILLVEYLPAESMKGILDYNMENESLAALIEQLSGKDISYSNRNIEAIIAGEYGARMLQIKKGAPIQHMQITTFLTDGTPAHYASAMFRGDRSSFSFTLQKADGTASF